MRNSEVAHNWSYGRRASNGRNSFWTDGKEIFSYQLMIGYYDKGIRTVIDFQSPNFVSQTTSQHVGLAKRWASEVRQPTKKEMANAY